MPILRASNLPLIEGKETTTLVQTAVAGSTELEVRNVAQFFVDQYILIGDVGNENSEIALIDNGSPPSAGFIYVVDPLQFSHSIDDKITQVDYNQVEFSRATTIAGAKSVLDTIDIEADDKVTTYNDSINSTGFGFVRYYNAGLGEFSQYSSAIPYTGTPVNAVGKMKDSALGITHEKIGGVNGLVTDRFILTELNNWQKEVASVKNWEFEFDSASISLVDGQSDYDLPNSPGPLKHKDTNQSIVQARFAGQTWALDYVDKREMEVLRSSETTGAPRSYTIFNDQFTVFPEPTSTEDGEDITIDYYIELPDLTDDQSQTRIPFYHLAQYYLAWKIEEVKGSQNRAEHWRQIWEQRLRREMNRSRTGQYFRLVPAIKNLRTPH
jgi:hypothetical protein